VGNAGDEGLNGRPGRDLQAFGLSKAMDPGWLATGNMQLTLLEPTAESGRSQSDLRAAPETRQPGEGKSARSPKGEVAFRLLKRAVSQ